jgi:hypothetical protein
MGRSLSWFIIPKNIEHDKTKKICIDLEYQPEDDDLEIKEKVFKIVNPNVKDSPDYKDFPSNKEWFMAYNKRNKEIKDSWYLITYHKNECWCPKCLMYINGLYGCQLLIDSMYISHSYSNSIWESDWNVKSLYMGSSTTDFVRRLKTDNLYREIFEDDIERCFSILESQGNTIRPSDIEAKEETLSVLKFLQKYVANNDVRVIISDEC